jgi:hypothetical protein
MSGWRKRQITDKIEDDMTFMHKIKQWYTENDVEITWYLLGLLTMGTLDSLAKGQYWFAGFQFSLIVANYLLRKQPRFK